MIDLLYTWVERIKSNNAIDVAVFTTKMDYY